ncbi:MAG: sulfatase [Planctomycetes bacterium]|nr:sulfatase [Planctomycetota bacterium]
MKIKRNPLIRSVAFCLFCLAAATLLPFGCGRTDPPSKPNIIVLLIDTLRKDQLGVYGSTKSLSPCFDRLARENVCFKNAIAPCSWTKPSVASLMTGLYPGTHGAIVFNARKNRSATDGFLMLSKKHETLAERMKAAGYRTAAFATNPHIIPGFNFDQGFDEFTQPAGDATELLTKAARWIENHGEKGRFFLYLHLIDPHETYFPPESFRKKIVKQEPLKQAPFANLGYPTEIRLWLDQYENWRPATPGEPFRFDYDLAWKNINRAFPEYGKENTLEELKSNLFLDFKGMDDPRLLELTNYLRALYDGEVAYTDDSIDKFLRRIEQKGFLENTILVVAADHGETFFEHGRWGHRESVHAQEINIPLIFRIPTPNGPIRKTVVPPVSLVDVFPTLLDLVGMPVPRDLEGLSLVPLIEDADLSLYLNRPVYSELIDGKINTASMVMQGLKVIRTRTADNEAEWLYYDIEADPLERQPLDPEQAGVTAESLKQALVQSLKNRAFRYDADKEDTALSKEELEEMRKLGYF